MGWELGGDGHRDERALEEARGLQAIVSLHWSSPCFPVPMGQCCKICRGRAASGVCLWEVTESPGCRFLPAYKAPGWVTAARGLLLCFGERALDAVSGGRKTDVGDTHVFFALSSPGNCWTAWQSMR